MKETDYPMKKRVTFLLVLILAAVLPASAQESGCDINLEQAQSLLFQAQREADSGNHFDALQTIDDLQVNLQAPELHRPRSIPGLQLP